MQSDLTSSIPRKQDGGADMCVVLEEAQNGDDDCDFNDENKQKSKDDSLLKFGAWKAVALGSLGNGMRFDSSSNTANTNNIPSRIAVVSAASVSSVVTGAAASEVIPTVAASGVGMDAIVTSPLPLPKSSSFLTSTIAPAISSSNETEASLPSSSSSSVSTTTAEQHPRSKPRLCFRQVSQVRNFVADAQELSAEGRYLPRRIRTPEEDQEEQRQLAMEDDEMVQWV